MLFGWLTLLICFNCLLGLIFWFAYLHALLLTWVGFWFAYSGWLFRGLDACVGCFLILWLVLSVLVVVGCGCWCVLSFTFVFVWMVVCGFVFWLNVFAYLRFKFILAGYAGYCSMVCRLWVFGAL